MRKVFRQKDSQLQQLLREVRYVRSKNDLSIIGSNFATVDGTDSSYGTEPTEFTKESTFP